jgi:nucleotide-binding universal stress UspA family protein
MKRILVPLNGSEFAEAAIPQAEKLARSEGGEIILLRVPMLQSTRFTSQDPTLASIVINDMLREANKYIELKVNKLRENGYQARGMIRKGTVSDTILDVAEEIHADTIVIATHAGERIKRWLMGSVTNQISKKAHIPVVLVLSSETYKSVPIEQISESAR